MASATQDDPLSTLLKKWIPYLPLPESTGLSSVAHKYGSQKWHRYGNAALNCGPSYRAARMSGSRRRFRVAGGPVLAEAGPSKSRFVRALPHGRNECSGKDQQEFTRPMPNYLTRRRQNQSSVHRPTDEGLDRRRLPSFQLLGALRGRFERPNDPRVIGHV
jgi:hypothetical protein